eukprot:5334140-Alexandrium_andersonii.AAC.1
MPKPSAHPVFGRAAQATPEGLSNPRAFLTVEVPNHPLGQTGPEAMIAGARNAPVVTAVPRREFPSGTAPSFGAYVDLQANEA